MCQVPDSCEGGMDSPCADGYEGPVCAICSLDYYKQSHICKKSPSKSWIAGQLSLVAVILLVTFSLLAWKRKGKLATECDLDLMDRFVSKLKILILPSHSWVTARFFLHQVARFFRYCCKVLRDTST